jgi:integrase
MPTTLESVVINYLRSGSPAQRTREEYNTTLRKWSRWSKAVPIEQLGKKEIREFLDWVHEDATSREGTNPGRTANKVRSHLRAVLSWAWENDLVDSLPRFPRLKSQRDVAGRHYLTKAEINALYFATHKLKCPRCWNQPWHVGRYWRCALVLFFNYGVDTGTIWQTLPFHEPILWRHISWGRLSPNRDIKELNPWGWLYYRRVKTDKAFWRPMNRTVRLHLKSIRPEKLDLDSPVFVGGGSRPNNAFRQLCQLAEVAPKRDIETGEECPWVLKDLRKTCATYYDEHVPESSVEILGHSVGGITYRHYAHRAPLAFRAILSLPQPSAFTMLARGFEDKCPCCRRRFEQT